MSEKVTVVARSFQAGTGGNGKIFNADQFGQKVARPIRTLLRFPEVIQSIIVVTNGEKGNRLAENYIADGVTPTIQALQDTFPEEVKNGLIIPHVCTDWGANPGSGNALNDGWKIADNNNSEWVMNWSPDIIMDGYRIYSALEFAIAHNLDLIGFLRELWWERPQWNVAQNTANIWKTELLVEVNGFASECNGTGETIEVEGFGETPVAGMEDFHTMLRILKGNPNFRWGMVGVSDPLKWSVNFEPGSEREFNHLRKVARQYQVMQVYVKRVFPELTFQEVMNKLFKESKQR